MKKNAPALMKSAVGLTILLGVLLILFANKRSFQNIIADDVENISRLSSSIIYAEIDNSLTQPIFVGQTMANDRFLKNWLAAESPKGDNPLQLAMIQQYLKDYRDTYHYTSAYVISAKSNIYYCQDGINKVISDTDSHDVWYSLFTQSGKSYDLDVDTDEVNSNQLTVFINCRITDDSGRLLGVAGVGIQMSHLQALLMDYETKYELKAFLIDENGLVQVDSVEGNIEAINFFSQPEPLALKDQILNDKTAMKVFWYPDNGSDHCLITKYVDNLDWYLVIEKNTAHTQQLLTAQIHQDLVLVLVLIVLVLLMISYIIGKYNRMLLHTAAIDGVTNLPNVKMFQEIYIRNTKRPACRQGSLFMFDIDHFKDINDQFGHMFGNTVLYRISEIATEVIGTDGVIARWGGDEFIGVFYGTSDHTAQILRLLVDRISNINEGRLEHITVSLGATAINCNNDLDVMIEEADKAMYRSKENGRNRITFF